MVYGRPTLFPRQLELLWWSLGWSKGEIRHDYVAIEDHCSLVGFRCQLSCLQEIWIIVVWLAWQAWINRDANHDWWHLPVYRISSQRRSQRCYLQFHSSQFPGNYPIFAEFQNCTVSKSLKKWLWYSQSLKSHLCHVLSAYYLAWCKFVFVDVTQQKLMDVCNSILRFMMCWINNKHVSISAGEIILHTPLTCV